jgi:hypothetical protein
VEWEVGLGTTTPHLVQPAANPKVYALRQRAALFGYNAPQPASLSDQTLGHFSGQTATADWTFTLAAQSVDLDTTYPGILALSWLVLARPDYTELYRVTSAVESARTGFTLAGKVTTCALDTTENLASFGGANLRGTMVFAQSELLDMAAAPISDPITGPTMALAKAPAGLAKGQWLVASGKDSATGDALSEIVAVSGIDGAALTVTPPLGNSYARDSFALNANVAPATHGETVQEILGSGDASQAYQQFTLKQPPLTYVSAATPSGAASTLALRVNDLLWHEVPTLYGRGPQEHVFVTRTDDAGRTTVEFGDGVTGARLPTGQDNVRAVYRKGIGVDGLVQAGQLSLLLTRPLGVKSVVNSEAATGAQDRESLDDARTNAPLTVLTLDRTVSLQDYEDFSRAFAGIAKALATWTWDGQMQRVFITVAGPDGAAIAPDSDTYRHLLEALQAAGDPFVSLRVQSYRPAYFRFAGKVKVDPAYQPSLVLAAVELALRTQFAFAARAFGQPVMLSEVIAVVQAVPGVVAVTVDKLYRTDEFIALHPAASPPILLVKKGTVFQFEALSLLNARLLAALPETLEDGTVAAAELLTLDPAPLEELGVMP